MTIRPILIHPDPRLKKLCTPVAEVSGEEVKLADDLLETMYDAPGIGLAAPQVGVTLRLLVMDCADKDEDPDPRIMFNPEITLRSDEMSTYDEGCLSIPDIYEEVTRPAEVRVRYVTREGEEREEDFAGLAATCVQHEIDHLDGRLFIDYLSALKRRMITGKMQKLKKSKARV